jgi:hypothetical protein
VPLGRCPVNRTSLPQRTRRHASAESQAPDDHRSPSGWTRARPDVGDRASSTDRLGLTPAADWPQSSSLQRNPPLSVLATGLPDLACRRAGDRWRHHPCQRRVELSVQQSDLPLQKPLLCIGRDCRWAEAVRKRGPLSRWRHGFESRWGCRSGLDAWPAFSDADQVIRVVERTGVPARSCRSVLLRSPGFP